MSLVTESSYGTRREAIEAISDVRGLGELGESDIFLVDLDAAVPVAVVPYRSPSQAPDPSQSAREPETVASDEESEDEDALHHDDGGHLGMIEIDIEAWSCEDCIYISTCAKAGTVRPADCGAFQWRA
jgi:hypothetical protein